MNECTAGLDTELNQPFNPKEHAIRRGEETYELPELKATRASLLQKPRYDDSYWGASILHPVLIGDKESYSVMSAKQQDGRKQFRIQFLPLTAVKDLSLSNCWSVYFKVGLASKTQNLNFLVLCVQLL